MGAAALLNVQDPQVAALFAAPPACDYSMLTKAVESVLHLLRFGEIVTVAGNPLYHFVPINAYQTDINR